MAELNTVSGIQRLIAERGAQHRLQATADTLIIETAAQDRPARALFQLVSMRVLLAVFLWFTDSTALPMIWLDAILAAILLLLALRWLVRRTIHVTTGQVLVHTRFLSWSRTRQIQCSPAETSLIVDSGPDPNSQTRWEVLIKQQGTRTARYRLSPIPDIESFELKTILLNYLAGPATRPLNASPSGAEA